MKRRMFVAVGLVVGLSAFSVMADFSDYYALPNPNLGGGAGKTVQVSTPLSVGNWTAKASGVDGNFSRSPDTSLDATAFTLTADYGGTSSLEIFQPTVAVYNSDNLFPMYYFSWNLNLQGLDKAWYVDATGTNNLPSPVGTSLFVATPGGSGAGGPWGFYVSADNNGFGRSEALQIQGWTGVPEPSSIAMGLITCFAGLGYYVRRSHARKV